MPIARLRKMRKDVRLLVEKMQDTQMKLSGVYISKNGAENTFPALWQKVILTNQKAYQERLPPEKLREVVSREEMLFLAGMHRWVGDEMARQEWETNPLAKPFKVTPVDAGGVPAEWHEMPGSVEDRVLLYLHGGGMITGSILERKALTARFSEASKSRVLSVNYRLAPEHPFPAGAEDCLAAYKWLLTQGIKPEKIIIGGDSAGGTLALALLLDLKEKGISLPGGAVCLSPGTDYSFDPESFYKNAITDPILADVGLFWWIVAYLGLDSPADPENPLVSPMKGNLEGLPPLLIQASACEMLWEFSTAFVEKAKAAGVNVTYQEWPDMIHVWQSFGLGVLPEAEDAIQKIAAFIQQF